MNKEFICTYDCISTIEEKINKWIEEGYSIEIIKQQFVIEKDRVYIPTDYVFTSLWRWKEEPKKTR